MLKIFALIALLTSLSSAPVENQSIYAETMYITDMNYSIDVVYCIDSAGFEYAFFGCEDYNVNDLITVIMSDNGTVNMSDDIILNAKYSGFWIEQEDEICGSVNLCWLR